MENNERKKNKWCCVCFVFGVIFLNKTQKNLNKPKTIAKKKKHTHNICTPLVFNKMAVQKNTKITLKNLQNTQ